MGITEKDVRVEMSEVHKDLVAFKRAYDAINQRIFDLEGSPRYEKFLHWAGTQAVMNVLRMCIVRCEGLLEDYSKALADNFPGSLN